MLPEAILDVRDVHVQFPLGVQLRARHPERVTSAKANATPPGGYRFHPGTIARTDFHAKPERSELIGTGPGRVVSCQATA